MSALAWCMGVGLGLLVALSGAPFVNAQPTEADLAAGEQVYLQRCAHCHGVDGDGVGASTDVVDPKPRDFTSGVYKFRTHHETEKATGWHPTPTSPAAFERACTARPCRDGKRF